jgi:hypothetical protein
MARKRSYIVLPKEPEKYDREKTLVAICAEAYENGNFSLARNVLDELERTWAGKPSWVYDPPQGPIRPMRIVRPWEQGK